MIFLQISTKNMANYNKHRYIKYPKNSLQIIWRIEK